MSRCAGWLRRSRTAPPTLRDRVWPILVFMFAVLGLGLKTFRRTLD